MGSTMLPSSTLPGRLPASNPGGNNQTNTVPGVKATPASGTNMNLPFSAGGAGTENPYYQASPSGSLLPIQGGQNVGSLYNYASSYASGQTDISKQLIDMYGKGVGGYLNNLLQDMSGTDSQIFQQYLASMKPVEASERAGLNQTLGAQGISGNSSVNAIANSNLTSQFNAQASQFNSQLMQTQLQDTLDVLMGVRGDAAKEVSASGWGVFADVMNNITGDIGNLMGGSFHSSGSNYGGMGSADNGAAANFGGVASDNSLAGQSLGTMDTQTLDNLPTSDVSAGTFDTSAGDEGIFGEGAGIPA